MSEPIHPHHIGGTPKLTVYVGGYTRGQDSGLYIYQLDLASGKLTPEGTGPAANNPSFLAMAPSRRFLYAVNEISDFNGTKYGGVSAYAIDPGTGALTFLNEQASGGSGPCHIAIDRSGSNALVANYGSGSVALLPIAPDGRLQAATSIIQHHGSSVNKQRQEGPHAHSINLDPGNRFALAADLGLDKILVYRFNAREHTLGAGDPPANIMTPGSGPRHFAYHPSGKFAYVINELGSTVTAFSYHSENGQLTPLQTLSTVPAGFQGTNYPAEVRVSLDGRFLYGSNRGANSIVIYRINEQDGRLTVVGYQPTEGANPRNFTIDPTGKYMLVANQDTGNIVEFGVNKETGQLTPTGQVVEAPRPVCIVITPLD